MIDIVIPNKNEEEFILMAEKLGYSGLCFLYNFEDYINDKKFNKNKIKVYNGVLAGNKDMNKIKDKKVFVAVKSSNNDRDVIEKSKANIIFSFEDNTRKDFIHQRASGLNHILCKLVKENNVMIGFSLNLILNAENKAKVIGRMAQNIKLCNKFKVKTIIASFAMKPFEMRSTHDMISLFESLGLKTPEFLEL